MDPCVRIVRNFRLVVWIQVALICLMLLLLLLMYNFNDFNISKIMIATLGITGVGILLTSIILVIQSQTLQRCSVE